MFNSYYQDELDFLRELGREFAHENPEIAHALTEPGADPDVERLLEGVAFLTGRIRQKLDDELPELIHSLCDLLWPHYLRPLPSLTIVEFRPREQLTGRLTVPRWTTELDSVEVEGTSCRFRTCYEVELAPLTVEDVTLETPPAAAAELHVRLATPGKMPLAQLGLERLRFHLGGEAPAARALYAYLRRQVQAIEVRAGGRTLRSLPPAALRPMGFGPDEALWPCPAHVLPGYRLLQEYFALPAKFLFVEVDGLGGLAGTEREWTLAFRFKEPPGGEVRGVGPQSLRLHCTPAVNLFPTTADPLRVDHRRTEYLVRPAGNPDHQEVYSIEDVVGLVRGGSERRPYPPLFSFRHGMGADAGVYYHARRRPALGRPNSEVSVSFFDGTGRGAVPPTEIVSLDLWCTNRRLAEGLRVGDLNRPTDSAPAVATFANLSAVTPSVLPPLGGDLHWRLVSHLALNYLSLDGPAARDALRTMLGLYNVPALYDRQAARASQLRLESLTGVRCEPADRLVRGTPVRGTRIRVDVREEGFGGEGDIYLLGCVLDEFLATYATVNSFTQLSMRGTGRGEVFEWQPRAGSQPLV